ncbi:hypothetical protein Dimus_032358 [Dionaea muscipula]
MFWRPLEGGSDGHSGDKLVIPTSPPCRRVVIIHVATVPTATSIILEQIRHCGSRNRESARRARQSRLEGGSTHNLASYPVGRLFRQAFLVESVKSQSRRIPDVVFPPSSASKNSSTDSVSAPLASVSFGSS